LDGGDFSLPVPPSIHENPAFFGARCSSSQSPGAVCLPLLQFTHRAKVAREPENLMNYFNHRRFSFVALAWACVVTVLLNGTMLAGFNQLADSPNHAERLEL
jgi:hypothetical protein